MKPTVLMFAMSAVMLTQALNAQTARDYFNELYQAGGLDRMADQYVCFDDDPKLQTFFIYAESRLLKDFLALNGDFSKLPKSQQERLNKGFLIVRGYDKGVLIGDEDFYDKDGSTWVSEAFKADSGNQKMRLRFAITPATLRYKRAVEILNPDLTLKGEYPRYGRCEIIPPTVQQKGNP